MSKVNLDYHLFNKSLKCTECLKNGWKMIEKRLKNYVILTDLYLRLGEKIYLCCTVKLCACDVLNVPISCRIVLSML